MDKEFDQVDAVNTLGSKHEMVSPRYNFNARDEVYYLSLICRVSKGVCRDIAVRPINLHSKEIVNQTGSSVCLGLTAPRIYDSDLDYFVISD